MVLVDKILIAIGIDPKGAQEGLDRIDHHIDHTDNKIKDLQNHAKGAAKHMIMSLAAPLLAAFSVGKVIQGYISDVAQVAEQTGAYSKQLEEARLKQAMLQRVTKEDVELYKRGREALVKFQIATADFGAALVRTAMPALKWLLDKLNGFTDWFSHNQNNIIRFLQVLASVITVALIPSVIKFTAALLKNPLVWVAGLVFALALAIDDLVVYLRGGRSEFDAFWKWLGFTKGDTETLTKAINWLKTSGVELLKTIGKLTAAFVGMRAVWGVISMVRKAWTALSLSVLANPVVLAIGLLIAAGWMLYKNWDDVCSGAQALAEDIADFFTGWGRGIADGFFALSDDIASAWDAVTDFFTDLIGQGANALSDFVSLCSDKTAEAGNAISTGFSGTWQGMKDGASALGSDIGSAFDSALDAAGRVWQGMKDGAGALVDDIEGVFSGLVSWFSNLWSKITGIFDSALGGIKDGISAVAETLGFGGDGGEDAPKDKYATMSDGEMAKRKAEIAETKRRKAEERQAGAAAPAREKVTIRDRVTPVIIGAGRASAVRAPAVSSTAVSSVRNSTSTSRVTNDNRRQEVNITINGNADRGTAQQIGTSVTDVFKSGAMSPVAG